MAQRPFSDSLAQATIAEQVRTIDRLTKELQEEREARRQVADELFDLRNRCGCGPEQSGPDLFEQAKRWQWSFDLRYRADMRAIKRWQAERHVERTVLDPHDRASLMAQLETRGWVVANGNGDKWRIMTMMGPDWVDDVDKALWFARRQDAEAFAEGDEDAWLVQAVKGWPEAASKLIYDSANDVLTATFVMAGIPDADHKTGEV